ncbi:transglutaminase TgpA family protein [Metasolibacillus fluoroglycofenilyticus]|uniref:transglutaminase TgpA family protein n=1 Tax=Metasolibacillus fluoroglycofenilyticus TaxID=1239396 RepID=UPI000D3B3005|nr:transglutaminaseTgpA domain-containing protein [Metasolibacillus fluoroglycofenilyticus]
MKKDVRFYLEYGIYYLIIFVILREWLNPIMELTNTGYDYYFLLFIALSLALALLGLPLFITWFIKIGYIAFFIIRAYSEFSFFSTEGLHFLYSDLQWNMLQLLQRNFTEVSNPFRTLLFLILIWMLVYLIHHWITVHMSVFYFLLLTVFFIATLDTFSDYDGKAAIVKVMLLGLMLTAFLFLKRSSTTMGTLLQRKSYMHYLMPVIVFVCLAGFVAFLLPKASPQWSDPVPFIKSLTGQGNGGGAVEGKVGYGENDETLGGGFSQDDTVVFRAHAQKRQYWRVETKDFYTTKGWVVDNSSYFEMELPSNTILPLSIPTGEEPKQAEIFPLEEFPFILQPYGLQRVVFDGYTILNGQTEKLQTVVQDNIVALDHYQLVYSEPSYSFTALKDKNMPRMVVDARFLQLPHNLPERVRQLAEEITSDYGTTYDKARAIERYFQQNDFSYDTKNIAYPAEDQDYVDQFLFETKRGYCDNFSTAMVVMLRAVDIPARWVKGFVGGEQVGRSDDGLYIYEVQNNDAHSWVEVYVDGVGWMPFEPTIGFSSPASIDYDVELTENEDELVTEEQRELEQQQREELEQATQNEETKATTSSILNEKNKKWLIVLMIALAAVGFLLYRRRRKWLPTVYVQMQRQKKQDAGNFDLSYTRLLKQLERYGFKRQNNQTLKNFAQQVDEHFGTKDMSILTEAYERMIYSEKGEALDYEQLKENWAYLINRTKG